MVKDIGITSFITNNEAWMISGVIIRSSILIVSSETTPMLLNVVYTRKYFHDTLDELGLSGV